MEYAQSYLKKYTRETSYVRVKPSDRLKYIVTIPAYLETRLIQSLVSLFECDRPDLDVEVLIGFNWPENESPAKIELSRRIIDDASNWIKEHTKPWIIFHSIVLPGIPVKVAGVGYARKKLMDEAVRRFLEAGTDDGIIISFDGDSLCDPNYFASIGEHFSKNPQTDGCSVYFEHPLSGTEFPARVYEGITQYELHLRYYLAAVRSTGFPFAFHTVGSAFAVRARTYCKQGGMNTKKAGEDFYFLCKLFELEKFTELNNTKVIPSPRPSLRVPFGTGATITAFLKDNDMLKSYNPCLFNILRNFFLNLPDLYHKGQLPEGSSILSEYLKSVNFLTSLQEIKANSSGYDSFRKRFFRYFNMFRIMKFLNYSGRKIPDLYITDCAMSFLKGCGMNFQSEDPMTLLEIFRKMERNTIPQQ